MSFPKTALAIAAALCSCQTKNLVHKEALAQALAEKQINPSLTHSKFLEIYADAFNFIRGTNNTFAFRKYASDSQDPMKRDKVLALHDYNRLVSEGKSLVQSGRLEASHTMKVGGRLELYAAAQPIIKEEKTASLDSELYTSGRIWGPEITEVSDDSHPECIALGTLDAEGRRRFVGTGILIAPTVVLTAAHVVESVRYSYDFAQGVYVRIPDGKPRREIQFAWLGNRIEQSFGSKDECSIKEIVVHKGYRGGFRSPRANDLALIFLNKGVKIKSFPCLAKTNNFEQAANSFNAEVVIVGFGSNTSDGRRGTGVKRRATTTLAANSPNYGLYTQGGEAFEFAAGLRIKDDSSLPSADTCSGDSGGPAYLPYEGSKSRILVGVTSRGISPSGTCGDGGVYERVDRYAQDFIIEECQRRNVTAPQLSP